MRLATGWPQVSDALHIGAAMQITLVPDSSIASAPFGLMAAVEAASSIFEQDFPGNYNVNISYGWGTFDDAPSAFLTNSGSGVFSLGGGTSSAVRNTELLRSPQLALRLARQTPTKLDVSDDEAYPKIFKAA